MAYPARATLDRFEDLFVPEPNSGCWLWLGAETSFGYGHTFETIGTNNYRQLDAHRLSWKLYRGPIPPGLCVLHRCDNPPCVNPDHLFLGTKRDNALDAIAKGRRVGDRGLWTHCKNGHEFTPDTLAKNKGQRRCRICLNEYHRRYQQTAMGRLHRTARNARRRKNG